MFSTNKEIRDLLKSVAHDKVPVKIILNNGLICSIVDIEREDYEDTFDSFVFIRVEED